MSSYIPRGAEYEAPIPTTENDATLRAILQRLQYIAPQQEWRGVSVECDPYREIVLVTVRAEADGLSRELSRPYDRSMLVAMADPAALIAEEFAREFPKPDRVPFRNPMRDAPPPPANRARYAARLANLQAHGPAWAAGTPHTDEEASVMCGQVEPRGVLGERVLERDARTRGEVLSTYRDADGEERVRVVPLASWRPTLDEHGTLRGGWLDAEVPVLTTLRERCEASACRPVVAQTDGAGPVVARYRGQAIVALNGGAGAEATLDAVLRCPRGYVDWTAHVGLDAEPQDYDARERREARAEAIGVARGWCEGLWAGTYAATRPVSPATADATWQAMRAAAPERVYPEPGE